MALRVASRNRPRSQAAFGQSKAVTWNPLAKQYGEPDTILLFDADLEAAFAPALGGVIQGNSRAEPAPWTVGALVQPAAGKFRNGIVATVAANGVLWLPDWVIPPSEWTIEFWCKPTVDIAAATTEVIFWYGFGGSDRLQIFVGSSKVQVTFSHTQAAAAVNTTLQATVISGQYPAGTDLHVALTYTGGTLTLYLNGVQKAQALGVTAPPRGFPVTGNSDGLVFGGSQTTGALQFSYFSDLRISQRARVPSTPLTVTGGAATLTVTPASPTGKTINQKLLAALQQWGGTSQDAAATGVYQSVRTDKCLTCTPIKAGGIDATHPSLGQSGLYSYDWQVVDRTINHIKGLGMEVYLSIDSCPQLLGGTVAPFSGTDLTTAETWHGTFDSHVPNDLTAFGHMAADLVYHIVHDLVATMPYVGVWNEPNPGGGGFWLGTQANYLSLYGAVAAAIRAAVPAVKLGGPEVGSWVSGGSGWLQALINYCATNVLPLDFVSWHHYTGRQDEITAVKFQVAAWAATAGIATPAILVGESSWTQQIMSSTGLPPWDQIGDGWTFARNDMMAAFYGRVLIDGQRNDLLRWVLCDPYNNNGWSTDNILDLTAQPFAPYNVAKMWSMMTPNVIASTLAGPVGQGDAVAMDAVASTDGAGKTTVFIAKQRYRKNPAPKGVTVTIGGVADSVPVRCYMVDDQHSNQFDAGGTHTVLEQVSIAGLSGGSVTIPLRPRAVALLVVGP